jgi:hypothetical protein
VDSRAEPNKTTILKCEMKNLMRSAERSPVLLDDKTKARGKAVQTASGFWAEKVKGR